MYCKNCGNEINENQAVCLNCGVNNGTGDEYCCYCGKEVNSNAAICLNCGMAIKSNVVSNTGETKESAYKKLAEYEKTAGTIWIVIAVIQIIIGIVSAMSMYFTPIILGIWNIIMGLNRIKYSKSLSEMPNGVYENFKKQGTSNIIFFVLNLFLGGIIGCIAAGYDIYIRKYVMDNEENFK